MQLFTLECSMWVKAKRRDTKDNGGDPYCVWVRIADLYSITVKLHERHLALILKQFVVSFMQNFGFDEREFHENGFEMKLNSGKVLAVGPGLRDKTGNHIPVAVKEGDTVNTEEQQ
uniref:Uncharacterized protein n=1 Tax=Chenopodium quinoa TaxID=63459 RepID=A0A803MBF7_CHEQI